jgi:[ribosomal protein S18]-alanine N-acetyltransferase
MSGNQRAAQLVIRRFVTSDAQVVEDIARKSPEAAQWSRATYEELEQRPKHVAWVAEAAGQVCGFLVALVVSGEAEILNLAVDPIYRRAGFADALLSQACAELQKLKAESIFLEVRESNLAAIRLYEKHRFLKAGERIQYYREPNEGAVLMIRKLTV